MSEQLDLNINNLCIPEDAFEKFQAGSMYEEEKVILLPHNDQPNQDPSELKDENVPSASKEDFVSSCGDVNNLANSNEIACSVEQQLSNAGEIGPVTMTDEDQLRCIDSNNTVLQTSNIVSDTDMFVSTCESNQHNDSINSVIVSSSSAPRKRGRKAKSHGLQTKDINISKKSQSPDISSTKLSLDLETPDTSKAFRKKPGRPRRVQPNVQNTLADAASDLSSSDNMTSESSLVRKFRNSRRGRPRGCGKKLSVGDNINSQEQHSSVDELASDSLNSSKEIVRKRKRKSTMLNSNKTSILDYEKSDLEKCRISALEKTDLVDNNITLDTNKGNTMSDNDDLDDICLSKLRTAPDQLNLSDSAEVNNYIDNRIDSDIFEDTDSKIVKAHPSQQKKKRGRPKRNTFSSQLIESLEPIALNKDSHINDDGGDDMCLSKLKTQLSEILPIEVITENKDMEESVAPGLNAPESDVPINEINAVEKSHSDIAVSENEQKNSQSNDAIAKRNSKMPIMEDFEYNIDSVVGKENTAVDADESLLVEDTSKRPVRRKIKKFKYEEDSDEDPFANVELSDDDEPRRGKRSNKYYSDDEYIPGKGGRNAVITSTDSETSDIEMDMKLEDNKKQRRRKLCKKSDTQSPRKRSKKEDEQKPIVSGVTTLEENTEEINDIEICKESEPLNSSKSWGTTTEFENFLAKKIQGTNLKIKKVSPNVPNESNKIEIPVLDPDSKKTIEMFTQTSVVPTSSKAVQTTTQYDIPMKDNVTLTAEQSEKACFFLNSIVKTTAELGNLMTQKSEDFIKKKINTSHVTDTFKMDYCVKKSFLLFKLAKHNLLQMEADLAKQYDQFLEANNLMKCREQEKKVSPTPKESDSDCEIVDVKPSPQTKTQQKKPAKSTFNPKTVFLNKELSIKIAKKPNENKKLDIKGRHTVWINDTVMVKKVKPTQSFLAQDSRNKKPPDNLITIEMVSDFFKDYFHQKVISVCAPFVSTDWVSVNHECVCNYFVAEPLQCNTEANYAERGFSITSTESNVSETSSNLNAKTTVASSPDTLFNVCFRVLKKQICCNEMSYYKKHDYNDTRYELTDEKNLPESLFQLSLQTINNMITDNKSNVTKIYPTCSTPEVYTNEPCVSSYPERFIIETDDFINEPEVFSESKTISLKSLCHSKLVRLLAHSSKNNFENQATSSSYFQESTVSLSFLSQEIKLHNANRAMLTNDTVITNTASSQEIKLHNANRAMLTNDAVITNTALPLKMLCHMKIVELLANSSENNLHHQLDFSVDVESCSEESSDSWCYLSKEKLPLENNKNEKVGIGKSLFSLCLTHIQRLCLTHIQKNQHILQTQKKNNGIKSLFSLCIDYIQKNQHISETKHLSYLTPRSLKTIAFESVKQSLYTNEYIENHKDDKEPAIDGLMINCVNTLSEEAFLNLEQFNSDAPDCSEFLDDFDNEDTFEQHLTDTEGDQSEPSWVSQVRMQELRSCVNTTNTEVDHTEEMQPIITQIKLEPLDDVAENLVEPVAIKTELVTAPDEMTIIPDVKPEIEEHIHAGPIHRENTYDRNAFEQFISSHKLMGSLTEDNTEEIYSQSSARIRRMHEPDNYGENDTDMLGLLVPHTYEPMSIQKAKGSLMESSSDESNKNVKNASKKVVKRKGRKKKEKFNNKETAIATAAVPTPSPALSPAPTPIVASTKEKEKQRGANNEVALLTRRMKEKIRQEEKKDESTDSENEGITLRLRSREKKGRKEEESCEQTKENTKPIIKSKINEIQCSNVDSTEQLDENLDTFTGFTSIETNEMSNYEKYMKFVYNKVIPEKEEELLREKHLKETSLLNKKNIEDKNQSNSNDNFETPLIKENEPVELLECEPMLPIFEENINTRSKRGIKSKSKVVSAKVHAKSVVPFEGPKDSDASVPSKAVDDPAEETPVETAAPGVIPSQFVDRHGWQCYPVNSSDSRLYQKSCIYLEKLPESFVQTYFQYQNIPVKDKSDIEINRLTNLNSLNRPTLNLKDRKSQNNSNGDGKDGKGPVTEDDSRTESAYDSDRFEELLPSDEEGPRFEDEVLSPVIKQTENSLAKNLLMNDNESEDEAGIKVKKESVENSSDKTAIENNDEHQKPRALSNKKHIIKSEEPTDLMLTADKMMNKELTLLHAPVVLDQQVKETPTKGIVTRHTKRSATKPSPPNNKEKGEEDSSSEEEKQWVSTKEKLLKRMGKKETTSADDAKRAKLVSEFIERREGNPNSHKRRGVKARRSGKKFLERQKQLRVLQRELFGETSSDPTVSKRSVAAWKGRRNIRKVLDKKSLARSTVIANMEEFERKRRLNARQTKLRELLGCEEGVNVLVINDEVCLEYDFEEHRPVVTIHPFFTKVMKAHQYEGVKFMWDACFESLADIESGHAGGGCILAHCMGLGKTLQVLALLHTVLTHPRVGMQRILVCCPLSTVLNWVDEIHKWIGPVTNQIKVFELSKLKKTYQRAYQLEDWYNGGGIFIIGYELFRSLSTLDPFLDDVRPTIVNKIRTALLDPGPDIIVCDEGHLLKNDCSVLAVSMSRVVTKRRIVLTGTPMQNNLREYYCMVNFVKPNLLGTYAEYSNRFENPIMNGQHRDSREEDIKLMKARTHILHKVLEGCLQRQEVSVLYPYLPKKHEYTVFITLTKCQWDLYKHYLKHYSRQLKQNSILKDFHILQKIWSHPQVLHNFQTKAQDAKAKIKVEKEEDDLANEDLRETKEEIATDLWWLQYLEGGNMLDSLEVSNKFVVVFRILDECVALGDKVLIFSTSLFCLDALEYFLKKINKWSLGREYYRLDGSVPPEVRQKWCREFNAENNVNTKLFLVSTRAGCLGLNMTAANRVIIMDTSWNPAHDIQSIFRVYRFGQKKDCYIYRLVALGTMEQKIYERSVTKQAVSCRVVDEQQIDRHYNMAELTELYRCDEAGLSVECGVAVGVSDVALLRVARETALHAVHEHDSLLRSSEQGLPEHERNAAWMQFQQEQAHKQMENKLLTNIPKISLKRLQGGTYSQSYELNNIQMKSEVKIEDTSDDFAAPKTNENKTRRGRKVIIPIPPSILKRRVGRPRKISTAEPSQACLNDPGPSKETTSMDPNHNKEELMVHQITEILIEHNFQNRTGKSDIANLVGKVRKIVNQGYIRKDDDIDDLTASIAKVLLHKNVTIPVATDIMCESINNTYSPKVLEEPEHILSTSDNIVEIPNTRRKRKAAIKAEKHLDSLAQNVIINLENDLDRSDSEFVPNIEPETQQSKRKCNSKVSMSKANESVKSDERITSSPPHYSILNTSTTEPVSILGDTNVQTQVTKPKSKVKIGPKTFKLKQKSQELNTSEERPSGEQLNSILLSDEDEPLANKIAKPATAITNTVTSTPITPEDNDMTPLPLSLLTNKNFINIVAHTYLNGNPMLDSDAATLAAQYSTYKSLKEAEETGRDITSGPIYDIAVKVIGKKLFKKMNVVNVKQNSQPVEEANVTIELREKMQELNEHNSKTAKKKSRSKQMEVTESISYELNETDPQPILSQYLSGNVVPVGLIKTTGNMQSDEFASSECILPDDEDDMRIVPHDLPALPKLHPAPTLALRGTSSIPTRVISAPSGQSSDPPQFVINEIKPSVIKISKGKVIRLASETSGNNSQPIMAPTPSPANDTICLDSDDEETITPTKTGPSLLATQSNQVPVPVSLSGGHPPESVPNIPTISVSKPNLVLRQIAGPGAAPKYVLVPTSSLPASKLTKISPKEIKPTANTLLKPDPILKLTSKKPNLTPIKPSVIPPSSNITSTKSNITPTKPIVTPTKSNILSTKPNITSSKPNVTAAKPNETAAKPNVTAAKSDTVHPESILSTKTSPAARLEKLKQARCKPGDIIKISETGDIEVLQVNKIRSIKPTCSKTSSNVRQKPAQNVPEKHKTSQIDVAKSRLSQSKIANSITSKETTSAKASSSVASTSKQSDILKHQKTYVKKSNPPKQVESQTTKTRTLSISSSSSESRPASPVDTNPLSILKNVVHIQAADDAPSSSRVAPSSSKEPIARGTKTSMSDADVYIENAYTSDAKIALKAAVSKTVMVQSKDSKSPKSGSKSTKPGPKSTKPGLKSKDLVKSSSNLNNSSVSNTVFNKDKSASKTAIDKCNTVNHKSFHSVDLTQLPQVTSGSGPSILMTKIEAKKRVSTGETSTPKKKKTELTLEDFSLDDIDDIIELD